MQCSASELIALSCHISTLTGSHPITERERRMQITIRGHHLSITPAIEESIRGKFSEMTKHLDQVNSMQVKLTKDHQVDKRSKKGSANHIAEAIVRLPGVELFAQASGDDMHASIKKLTEKIKKQLTRYRKMQMEYQPLAV